MTAKGEAKMERDQIERVAAAMWEACREQDRNRRRTPMAWTRLSAQWKVYIRAAAEWAITHGAQQ